ncbi:MAG: valine--tRNA ligase [Candidatus Omnitrophica bacterium]|nr:valine--tRNA ligase [Candidatus Omnitrophota bacterium]
MPKLPPRFNFTEVEAKWCKYWEDNHTFHATPKPDKKPYTIVIPPPNVTGILHMGHGLNNTLQDIMARYKRMNGFETCWMVGTDHAGIATQNVVEKQLAKEGKTRYDIGRDEMLNRLWAWKEDYGGTIINQLKKLGSSCDWDRLRFTMDDGYSQAVKHVFVELYKKNLIYRGKYIINWCPRCQTALSDEEAEHKDTQGNLYHIKYPFKDIPNHFVTVATTRPETMLGDTAVAVNPADKRYQDLIGKILVLPIIGREIKIIADELVDPAFGSGAVKVTPAHDPNDFTMGTRHNLEFINIMHPDAKLNKEAGKFEGLDRFDGRKAVIDTLKNLELIEKIEPHIHAVGHCYRCNTVVEPYLSKQWFVNMKPLAKPALKAVVDGTIKFYPDRWTKVYINWMEGIRDWCISRQIWWGHRIPVWYCGTCEDHPIVSETIPTECPHCHSKDLKQDEDVLDTWFSSWLWPFATFGWPGNTFNEIASSQKAVSRNDDLKYFYPTNSLFTASEIIFFWVSRMVMAGYEFMGEAPFKDVYIHGTVRDAKGRKMSKSLGNALDPLEIIAEYGADALRFSLIMNSGQDLFISKEKFEGGRNFANKIWNASRLILINTKPENRKISAPPQTNDLASQWIISKFYTTLTEVNTAIEGYRFSEAENLIYDFFWKNYCDWFLEISKNKFSDDKVQQTAFFILKESLRMIHPFMPFVTEELWENLTENDIPLSLDSWPKTKSEFLNVAAIDQMDTLINLVSVIRNIRSQWHIKPQEEIECYFAAVDSYSKTLLKDNSETLTSFLKLKNFQLHDKLPTHKDAASGVVSSTGGQPIKFTIPLGELVDLAKEKAKMQHEIMLKEKSAAGISQRLKNESFVSKAPADVIEKEQARLIVLIQETKELQEVLKNLQ